ncbi:hypothetical protein MVEG_00979 [Podila verticillata NRRL 6337]|nr:hypothetical protein MVEG_00979 [Podila verticillata NRRL 6337]
MLDINLFLKERGGDPEIVRESQRRRHAPVELVDEIIELYHEWKTTRFDLDQLNKKANAVQDEIKRKMKAKDDAADLIKARAEYKNEQEILKKQETLQEERWNRKLGLIGNLVHDSVPVSNNENDNVIVKTYFHNNEAPLQKPDIHSHDEVLYRLGAYDPKRGQKVASHRGYFLTDVGVELNLALIQFGLAFLGRRKYKKLQTPYFMKQELMQRTAQLSQFDEELYKVTGKR